MEKEECKDAAIQFALEKSKKDREKKEKDEWNAKKKELMVDTHAKEYKKAFQDNINKLARMIDTSFGYETCIDCTKGYGKQTDAAHFHSRGANNTLRYNLHNLHSANSQCNQWSDVHHVNYAIGLEKRYGKEYREYVEDKLPLLYPEIHLTNKDIVDKLKIVRGLIKNFDTYKFENSLEARTQFNSIIGIYKLVKIETEIMKAKPLPEKEDNLIEPKGESCLIEPESKLPFFTEVPLEANLIDCLNEIRKHKNNMVKMRDLFKGTDRYYVFDDEVSRLIKFLNRKEFAEAIDNNK